MLQSFRDRWRDAWGSKLRRREMLFGYVCLIPYGLGFLVFLAGPLAYSAWLSFNRYDIVTPPVLVGFDNYRNAIKDPLFWKSLQNTTIYTIVSVPMNVIIGYSVALMLNQKVRGLSFWRAVYYMPSVVPAVATAYLFAWMFNGDVGLVNAALRMIGIQGPNWFGSKQWALPTFIIMNLWGAGGGMVIYLAALQGVPTLLYDAARIDGANDWQRFWNVTVPMTSPAILFMFIMGIIGSFQVFTSVLVITDGAPVNATLMYVLYLYRNGWKYFNMGYAATLAWVLFAIILAVTLLTLKLSGRLVYYEDG
jgi:multiple sugar transport system permease protein